MKRTATYELFCKGVLVCRGTIDDVADALGISVSTARVYASQGSHGRVSIKRLPILYEVSEGGNLVYRDTCEAVAERLNVSVSSIMKAARSDSVCAYRFKVRKYIYKPLMMDVSVRDMVVPATQEHIVD